MSWLHPLFLLLPAFALVGADTSFPKDIRPLLETYCFKCHGPEKHKGDLILSTIASEDAARRATRIWRSVLEKLDAKDMPPEKAPQPTAAEAERLSTWIRTLKPPEGPPDPGRVTIRRLNRSEYDNTIRDLLGLDLKLAQSFPSDDVGEGFDNIGDVLSLPPLLLEKYLDAAQQVLDKAIVVEQIDLKLTGEQLAAISAGKPLAGKPDGKARTFTTAGEVYLDVAVPADSKFQLKIRAGAEQAGNEPVTMAVRVDNEVVKEIKVLARISAPTSFPLTLSLTKGARHIAVAFTNPYTETAAPATKPAAGANVANAANPKAAAKPSTRELLIDLVELKGPPSPPIPESHKRIFIAKPSAELSKHDAAKTILAAFATRAFRQPVSADKLDHLLALFDLADKQGEAFEEAIKVALQAVLVSPHFLFRVEQDRPSSEANGAYPLNDWELASRLSYFLWSTMPDAELFEQAKQGKLHEPANLEQQARRLLKDPKAHALVETFAEQWLQLRTLEARQPDPKKFPEFDPALRKAMYDEAALFFETVMHEDRSILEFIDADYTFLNERLAKHYGIANVSGPQMRKVQLSDHNRGGVLTMAGILTITSNPTRTSPVKRGKWILEEIVGDPPPPPPPAVGELPEQGKGNTAGLSLRQLMEKHRTDPVCASCHQRMDPIGFGFENFDAIGRWRNDDDGKALDTSGTLPGGKSFKGPAELKLLFLGRKEAFARCLSEKLLTFALGRGLKDYDDVTVEAAAKALAKDQYRFSTLVAQIVTSYPFRYRRHQ